VKFYKLLTKHLKSPPVLGILLGLLIALVSPPIVPPHISDKIDVERPSNCLDAYFYDTPESDTLSFVRLLRKSVCALEVDNDYRSILYLAYDEYVNRYNLLAPPSRHWIHLSDLDGDLHQDVAFASSENDSNKLYVMDAKGLTLKSKVHLPIEGQLVINKTRYFKRDNDGLLYLLVVSKVGSARYTSALFSYDCVAQHLSKLYEFDGLAQSYNMRGYEDQLLFVVNAPTRFSFHFYDLEKRTSRYFFEPRHHASIPIATINEQVFPYENISDVLVLRDENWRLNLVDLKALFEEQRLSLRLFPNPVKGKSRMRLRYTLGGVIFYTISENKGDAILYKYLPKEDQYQRIRQWGGASVGDVLFYGDIEGNGKKDIVYTDVRPGSEAICVQEEGRFYDIVRHSVAREKLFVNNVVLASPELLLLHSKGVLYRLYKYHKHPKSYLNWLFYIGTVLLIWFVMFSIYQAKQNREYRLRENSNKILQLQLTNIQRRIDPHFIFNSLNNLGALILEGNSNESYDYLSKVSKVLYQALSSREILVSLEEELDFCTSVLDTQHLRFKGRFDYEVFIDKGVDMNIHIPSNILNSMTDNALKHGFSGIDYLGFITIEIFKQERGVLLIVEDNGQGREAALKAKDQVKSTGTGLSMCFQYVKLFNQKRKVNLLSFHIIDLYNDDNTAKGTRCEFYLPSDLKS